jgi:hypothetical protein
MLRSFFEKKNVDDMIRRIWRKVMKKELMEGTNFTNVNKKTVYKSEPKCSSTKQVVQLIFHAPF